MEESLLRVSEMSLVNSNRRVFARVDMQEVIATSNVIVLNIK